MRRLYLTALYLSMGLLVYLLNPRTYILDEPEPATCASVWNVEAWRPGR